MTYTLTIKDQSGNPIPGGYIDFVTGNGSVLAKISVNNAGVVLLDSEMDSSLFSSDITAVFNAPGYWNYGVSAATLPQSFTVTLEKRPISGGAMLGLGLAAGALVVLIAEKGGGKRKRRVRGLIGTVEQASKRQGLPGWVFPLAAIGVGGLLVYEFFNRPDAKAKDSAQLPTAAGNELDNLKVQGQIPMITQADAESFSTQIVQATDDCGTDEQAIYNVFYQLFSDADFWFLVKVFGVRQVKSCFGGNYFGNTPYNLIQIITEELDSSEKAKLNQILVDHGITYQF